jgi:hypothetical protein
MRNFNTKLPVSFLVSFLLLAVALCALPLASFAQNQKNTPNIDQLRQKAWSEGHVQVIVHFVVPEIEQLTAASAQFWGGDETPEIARARTMADTNLIKTIEYSSWKILTELQGTDFEVVTRFDYIPFITLRVSPNALALLENSPDVLGVEEDLPQKLIEPVEGTEEETKGGEPADDNRLVPMLADTATLVGAKTVWGWGYTGAGWYVAVLDTGIRKTHQFFTGKTIIEACRAKGRDGHGPGGDCPNGSWTQNGPGSAVHYPSTYEGYDHGTHVSGIATGNYGTLAGIAKGAGVIAVKVFCKFTASDCGGSPCVGAWDSDSVAGLNYIYSLRNTYHIASVNMSLGGGRYYSPCNSDSHKASIDLLRSVGIATAIATGNNGWCTSIASPACIPTSVAVGSSTKNDYESIFNNYHTTMQKLFAPGTSIYSSTGASDSSYEYWNGTSMATPHVAGAWALLKQAIPSASVTTLLNALRNTGKGITSVCDGYSYPMPRIQIDKALTSLIHFDLTIQASAWGTTTPAPGVHSYPPNANAQVTATPAQYATFVNWTGDASGTNNPVTVIMNKNKTIKANFHYIHAPIATGEKVLNRSFSQAEYIDNLSWQNNANNAGLTIATYKIYTISGSTTTLLTEVNADQTTYSRRNAGDGANQYAIAAVTSGGREGTPALVTVEME